ncbi:hypothetical protein B1813_17195 [Saccharomonospora piscinae]|uniref:Uncharacterized protein n=1 Tax=Saccharomonospora piscinae TaxID=687388 RepID=A0A1V8ZZH5_SACPI|nr:hypothetical protein B1813_17195 [Saccharomonospora piscinae]
MLSVLTVLLVVPTAATADTAAVGAAAVPAAAAGAQPVPVLAQDDTTGETGTPSSTEEGPELDPQTEAEAAKNQSKIVVGVIAAVLLGLVLWGRYVRKKNANG